MEISNLNLNDNESRTSVTYLYTGTSCINNGKHNAQAAVTVCFNENYNYTVTELLSIDSVTNQKAELCSIKLALDLIKDETIVSIVSRSTYAIESVNNAYQKLQKEGKFIPSKKNAENNELVSDIIYTLNDLRQAGKTTDVYHVSQIPNNRGNKIAQDCARKTLLENI